MKILNNIINFIKNMNKVSKILIICGIAIVLIIISFIFWYNNSLKAVSKKSDIVNISIDIGSGSNKIATILKQSNVIKSEFAFKLYIKLNSVEGLQAGNYAINKNLDVPAIINVIKTGSVLDEQISITFIEGKNMRWIAKKIADNTNNTEDAVYSLLKDKSYIDSLISNYWFISNDIKNSDIYYPLEGYLFPDTYFFINKDVSVKDIFKAMLDKMGDVLSGYKSYFDQNKYSVHEILSLASLVELEGIKESDRKDIASVFYNRLNQGISLGSDVTTYYAFKVDMAERDLTSSELYTYNPYNTRGPNMAGKLPVGPIASCSKSSIEASISPSNSKYLFFVADKNGKAYFAKSLTEHENIVTSLKNQGLWYEY